MDRFKKTKGDGFKLQVKLAFAYGTYSKKLGYKVVLYLLRVLLIFVLQDIFGEVARFSLDQAGSRFLQRNLSIASKEAFDKVFEEAFVNIGPFMVDTYANYIVQVAARHKQNLVKYVPNSNPARALPCCCLSTDDYKTLLAPAAQPSR